MADEVLVDIPAGIEDGQTVRLRIDGEQEVLVQVRVEDGGNLRREGYHVHSDLWIDIWDAAFGKTVTIPGLHGNIILKIPKRINSHTVLVLPERGFQVSYIFLFASFDLILQLLLIICIQLSRLYYDIAFSTSIVNTLVVLVFTIC